MLRSKSLFFAIGCLVFVYYAQGYRNILTLEPRQLNIASPQVSFPAPENSYEILNSEISLAFGIEEEGRVEADKDKEVTEVIVEVGDEVLAQGIAETFQLLGVATLGSTRVIHFDLEFGGETKLFYQQQGEVSSEDDMPVSVRISRTPVGEYCLQVLDVVSLRVLAESECHYVFN